MGNSAKRDQRKVAKAELAREVLRLRGTGASYDQIAEELKLANRSVPWKLFKFAIKEVIREPAEAVLTIELSRLDAMLSALWPRVADGDTQAIDRALRIMERRAAYLGLDQPKGLKVELNREVEGILNRVSGQVDADVYERILAAIGGGDSPPPAGSDSSEEDSGSGEGDGD